MIEKLTVYFNSAQKILLGLATLIQVTNNINYVVIHCYFVLPVLLSAYISAAPDGQISV